MAKLHTVPTGQLDTASQSLR